MKAGEVTFLGQMKVLTKKTNSGADELSLRAMQCCGVLVPYLAIVFWFLITRLNFWILNSVYIKGLFFPLFPVLRGPQFDRKCSLNIHVKKSLQWFVMHFCCWELTGWIQMVLLEVAISYKMSLRHTTQWTYIKTNCGILKTTLTPFIWN